MDLTSALYALVAPARIGESLATDVTLVDASSELGLRLVVEHRGAEVAIELDPVEEGRRFAARTKYFSIGYRVGDHGAPVPGTIGRALCETIAHIVERNEESVIAALRSSSSPDAIDNRVRETRGERLLQRAGQLATRYFTLSPYVGCLIGCRFCYAPSRLDPVRRMAGLPDARWGSWVDVRVDAPEVLARELDEVPPLPIKLCPIVSDPYHAIERRYRLTRRCLEVLRDAAPRDVLVLTRSALIAEDAALIASIPRGWAGVSLPTIDDDVRRHFEPRGASVEERLAALDTLRAAGARTFAIVQPMFPGSVERLADALAARVESARLDVLYGTYGAAEDFAAYPEVGEPSWQRARLTELAELLAARGVRVWPGELP